MATPLVDARKILRDLVAIPSVHPEADPGGTVPGEAAVAEWLAAHLRRLGADVRTTDLAPGRPTVVGVFEPARPARATVAFAPHLDTVGGNCFLLRKTLNWYQLEIMVLIVLTLLIQLNYLQKKLID